MAAQRTALTGVAASPGVARGPWTELGQATLPAPTTIAAEAVEGEVARLKEAAKGASVDLRALASEVREAGHQNEAAIFGAQAAMARDPELLESASALVASERIDPVTAVTRAAERLGAQIAQLEDELLRARATDVRDVGDRIARRLAGLSQGATLSRPSIVVADDLSPSLTATLPRERLLGIALERSSPTAHAAILARAYGIPAVVGVSGLLEAARLAGGDAQLALDGGTGELVFDPSAEEVERFDQGRARHEHDRAAAIAEGTGPVRTSDGIEVTLLANIGNPDEAQPAIQLGARGVGLFRTEFLFLDRAEPPTEDEQVEAYESVIRAFAGLPVTIRLLDIGGDKPMAYLPMPREDNPFLGVRALRLATQHPELFITQLRACYRAAAAGPVRVMAPMIADASDVDLLHALARTARGELTREGVEIAHVELGVMLEIPSSVLAADTYFGDIAFASLGTNDLLQYTLAVDRGNAALERYRDALHPALLRLIQLSAEAAAGADISLSVCGEMAGDPVAALALIGLGVRNLSMSASSLPAVRRAIRASDASVLAREAQAACADGSAHQVRHRFEAIGS